MGMGMGKITLIFLTNGEFLKASEKQRRSRDDSLDVGNIVFSFVAESDMEGGSR